MVTGNLKLTFWCVRHAEVCYATRESLRVVCEQGNEVLSEDFRRDPWHFCSGCQTFFGRADNQVVNKDCPACGQIAGRRYLCHQCGVFSFEAAGRSTTREFAFGATGTPAFCAGCLQKPPTRLRDHDCQILGSCFLTGRMECPFCGERLEKTDEFPVTFHKPLAEYLQHLPPNAFRAGWGAPGTLVVAATGQFWLTRLNDDQTFMVFPDVVQFLTPQDYLIWQNAFHCPSPNVGEITLVGPAVAKFNPSTSQFHLTQHGELEVYVKDKIASPMPAFAETPTTVPVNKLPEWAVSNLSAVATNSLQHTSTNRLPVVLAVAVTAGVFVIGIMVYSSMSATKSENNGQVVPVATTASVSPMTSPSRSKKAPRPPESKVTEMPASRRYSGTINGTINLEMELRRTGSELSGSYFYKKIKTKITLKGTVSSDDSFEINGFDTDGTHIDVFTGRFGANGRVEGNWSKPDGSRVLPFSLSEIF